MTSRSRRRALAPVLLSVLVAPHAADAQAPSPAPAGVVRGAVHDSLLGRPLAGASVWVEALGLQTTTDSVGRFVIADVPAGRRAVGASHPELEQAGIPMLGTTVLVGDEAEATVALATPSPATLRARLCPRGAGDDAGATTAVGERGVVFGEVRDARTDARLAGATAVVTWTRVDTVRGKLAVHTPSRVVRTDSIGVYYACDVPTGVELEMLASAPPFASGRATIAVGPRLVTRFDLLVSREPEDTAATAPTASASRAAVAPGDGARGDGARGGRASVSGFVRDSTGAPFRGARVTVEGAAGEARTDADGRFTLGGLPAGTQTLVVRAVGYAPQLAAVGLRNGAPAQVDVTMRRIVTIAGVNVTARSTQARLLKAMRDRTLTGGYVLDSTVIRRGMQLRTAMHQAPFTHTASIDGTWVVVFQGRGIYSGARCVASVWLDGRLSAWEEINGLSPDDILGVEIYRRPSLVPQQYDDPTNQGCGAVLLWTNWAR